MGDRTGRIISTRARVDHVAINNGGICHMLNVCVCILIGKVQAVFRLFFVSLMAIA